jgi:hypothetical protein
MGLIKIVIPASLAQILFREQYRIFISKQKYRIIGNKGIEYRNYQKQLFYILVHYCPVKDGTKPAEVL